MSGGGWLLVAGLQGGADTRTLGWRNEDMKKWRNEGTTAFCSVQLSEYNMAEILLATCYALATALCSAECRHTTQTQTDTIADRS